MEKKLKSGSVAGCLKPGSTISDLGENELNRPIFSHPTLRFAKIAMTACLVILSACAVQRDSVLDTEVLGSIQDSLDNASMTNAEPEFSPVSDDNLLEELLS
jgi:hypothetical protein